MEIAGIILAGGLGSRMGYVKKAFLEIGGKTTLDRILEVYRPLFPEIILATRDAQDYLPYGYPLALDRYTVRSSLTGIHAGLETMDAPYGFFTACDTPFLQRDLVKALLSAVTPEVDIVIPLKKDGYREPLCAIYSKRCIPPIARQLEHNDFKIIHFFEQMNVLEIPVEKLCPKDPDLLSFVNINRPEELAQAQALALKQKK